MNSVLQDVLARSAFHLAIPPQVITDQVTGDSVDFTTSDTDGPAIIILMTGTVGNDTELSLAVEESDNEQDWSNIADGELDFFAPDGEPVTLKATRTKRYIRCVLSIDGTTPSAAVAVLITEPRKLL